MSHITLLKGQIKISTLQPRPQKSIFYPEAYVRLSKSHENGAKKAVHFRNRDLLSSKRKGLNEQNIIYTHRYFSPSGVVVVAYEKN